MSTTSLIISSSPTLVDGTGPTSSEYTASRIRNPLLETIDSLPEKDFVKDQVKSVADDIPSSDYVHEKIDDYVEVLGSAVEEFNETD